MKDNYKNKIIVLTILTIVFTIMGSTLAFWSWNTSEAERTLIGFTVEPNLSCTGDGGGNISSSEKKLVPTSCTNQTYAIQRTITLNTSSTISTNDIFLDLWLDVVEIGEELTNSQNFKYAITKNPNDCTTNAVTGSFNGITNGGRVNLLKSKEYIGTNQDTYYLYIWLDEAEENTDTMNQSFELKLGGSCQDDKEGNSQQLVMNEYGFYYNVPYVGELSNDDGTVQKQAIVFYEDKKLDVFLDGYNNFISEPLIYAQGVGFEYDENTGYISDGFYDYMFSEDGMTFTLNTYGTSSAYENTVYEVVNTVVHPLYFNEQYVSYSGSTLVFNGDTAQYNNKTTFKDFSNIEGEGYYLWWRSESEFYKFFVSIDGERVYMIEMDEESNEIITLFTRNGEFKTITFTINDIEYQALLGMTWEDWFNTNGGQVEFEDSYLYYYEGFGYLKEGAWEFLSYVRNNNSSDKVMPSDLIIENHDYYVYEIPK